MGDVLGLDDDDILLKALDGLEIDTIPDVLRMKDVDIDIMEYEDMGTKQVLPLGRRNLLKTLQAWNFHLLDTLEIRQIDWNDEDTINEDEWDDYRVSTYDPNVICSRVGISRNTTRTHTSGSISAPSTTTTRTLASEFRRASNRDKAHYRELKSETHWDEWRQATLATVASHGCENVLNTTYVPVTQEDVKLFQEMQKFMYDVFVSVLQTSMGRFMCANTSTMAMRKQCGESIACT